MSRFGTSDQCSAQPDSTHQLISGTDSPRYLYSTSQ